MGCLRQVGCLAVVGVVGVAAWLGRDLWWERVTGWSPRAELAWSAPAPDSVPIETRLARARSDAFVSLGPAELAGLIEASLGGILGNPEVAIHRDVVHVRGRLTLSELTGAEALGPLAGLLRGEPRVEIAGRPTMATRGSAGILVTEIRVGGVEVPAPMRAAVLRQFPGGAAAGIGGSDAIRFSLPSWVGDLRVANGKLTVYKDRP